MHTEIYVVINRHGHHCFHSLQKYMAVEHSKHPNCGDELNQHINPTNIYAFKLNKPSYDRRLVACVGAHPL